MGNEMGNNNTSAIKEEENITETEEKTLLQDTSELQNGVSQDVDADIAKLKNQPILTSTAKDVMEKAEEAYNDAITEPGKDTLQEDNHADDVKGKIQTVSTAESEDVQEKATCFVSQNTTSMHSLEGDTSASDMIMENQMYPTTEAEHVQETPTVLDSDCSAIEHGKVTIQDVYAVDKKEKIHMIPTGEAKDVQEEAKGLISNNTASILENDSLDGDTDASNVNMENQMHPEAEAKDEDVQEKPTGLDSEYNTISSLEKDLLKGDDAHAEDSNVDHEKQPTAEGKDDQEIASKLCFDDKTNEHQEDKHDADVVILMANGTDVQGKDTVLFSGDPLNLRTSFSGAVHDITEARQPEKSPNTGSVEAEGENHEILSSSLLEGSEECENQKESCLTKPLLITYDLLDNEPSIKQDNTLKSDHEDNSKVLCEESTMGYSNDYSLDHCMEDTHASDMSMENQMYPTTEVEHVQEKPTVLASDCSAIEHGKVTIQDVYAVDMKEKIHMIPTGEAKDVQEEATGLISNNIASVLENDSLDGDTNASNVSMENQMHPEAEAKDEDVQEKPTGLDSEYNRINSLEKDLLKGDDAPAEDINVDNEKRPTAEGKDDQEITSKLCFDDKTSEPQDEPQEDKQDADVVIPMTNKTDVQGKDTILASDDPLDLITSFGGAVHDITEARQPEQSPNTGSVEAEGENHEILSSSSLEGTEECGNRKESCLTKPLVITYDLLDNEPSIKQDNTLKSDHEDNRKVLCEESTMGYSYDYSLDHCKEETLKDFKVSKVSMVNALASDISWIANTNKVEEPKVSEVGLQLDARINNCKASDETNFVSEPKHSVVPEAEMVSLIGESTVVDCKHESGENYKIKMEETNGKLEASYANVETSEGTEMSKQCNSDLVTINQEEYFTFQNSSSVLHIYDCHQGNVKLIKSFPAISMPDSEWKQTNDTFDSSKSTVPSLDLVDDEEFETEVDNYTQYIEANSLKGAELTTSVATMSSEVPCLNNSVFASGGYETREIATRLSTESESDNPNISQMQKSPSFNLNLRVEARPEESDQAPLLYQEKFSNERMSNQASLIPNAEYDQCKLQNEEMPVEEKIVTMERSYSEKSKANLVVMPQTQDSHSSTKKDVKEESSTSPIGKEKHKTRSSFFSSFMCCATRAN